MVSQKPRVLQDLWRGPSIMPRANEVHVLRLVSEDGMLASSWCPTRRPLVSMPVALVTLLIIPPVAVAAEGLESISRARRSCRRLNCVTFGLDYWWCSIVDGLWLVRLSIGRFRV